MMFFKFNPENIPDILSSGFLKIGGNAELINGHEFIHEFMSELNDDVKETIKEGKEKLISAYKDTADADKYKICELGLYEGQKFHYLHNFMRENRFNIRFVGCTDNLKQIV